MLPARAGAQPVAKASFLSAGSFSLPVSGPGALAHPQAIAWAPSGLLHIADEGGTVAVYDSAGTYVRGYGGDVAEKIAGLAVDANGRAYVLDPDAKTVFVFDSTGAVEYRIGSEGNKAGQLDDPVDVALGPAGLVYVLDKGRKGVQVFSLDGTFVHDIRLPIDAQDPKALGVGPSGKIYVADKNVINGVVRLPSLTEALGVVDAPSPAAGRLPFRGSTIKDPVAVVATPTGTVVAADRDSGVLWSADATGGEPVGSDDRLYGGKGSGRGSFRKLADAALVGTDELVMLDRDGHKVERVRLTLEADRAAEAPQDYPVQFQSISPKLDAGVLATAPTGHGTEWYAIADADGRNIRVVEAKLADHTGIFGNRIRIPEVASGKPVHSFGTEVERAGYAALNDTLLVVSEPRKSRFHVFDLRTDKRLGSFGDNYSDDRRLKSPRGVSFFPDGRIAVADHDNGRIAVFSADVASLLGTFPLPKAEGVVISADGRMFAWDEDGITAGEFPLSGGALKPLPASMTSGGVGALTTDRAGNVYALRRQSGRVAIVNQGADRLLARLGGEAGLEDGDRLTVDVDGNIYATDLEHAGSETLRWGVDVPAVTAVTVAWKPGLADLGWKAVTGSFVTGYQVEGAAGPAGPWSVVAAPTDATARIDKSAPIWFRVSVRSLTGAVGRPSPAVPVLHLAADSVFRAGDWSRARQLAREALAVADSGDVTADPAVVANLDWHGFVAAHEARDYKDVLFWNDRLGESVAADRRFDRAFRLADTYQATDDTAQALDQAQQAIEAAGGPSDDTTAERLQTLRQMVFDDGWALKRWSDVTAAGEDLLQAAGEAPDAELIARLSRAYLKAGTPDRAMELALTGLDSATSEDRRHTFTVLSYVAAVATGDTVAASQYESAVGDSVPESLDVDFEAARTQDRLAHGDLPGAQAQLEALLLGQEGDIRALADPGVVQAALKVYGGLVEADNAQGGRQMLDSLVAAMPSDLADAREQFVHQADSVAAVADTRAKLGKGFGFFRDALFRDALRFFQKADGRSDLDVDQRLIVKEILAAVYHSLGRVEDADNAFRGVYKVDPDYVLDTHVAHVKDTYGLTVFAPEMLEHFRGVGPVM